MAGIGIEAVAGKKLVVYDDLQRATGKSRRTLYNDVQRGLLPKPEARGVWIVEGEKSEVYRKLCEYIDGTAGPGQGARTDLRA